MNPAQRLALAAIIARQHTHTCRRGCGMPAVERSTAACPLGRDLERAWLRAWRRRIDAMTGGV